MLLAALALASCGPSNLAPLFGDIPDNPTVRSVAQAHSGRTFLTTDRENGVQVRYFAGNGRSFLWYPGNTRGVSADWRIQNYRDGDFARCFKHSTTTFAPVSGATGRVWRCSGSLQGNLAITDEIVEGDVFNLSRGAVPFVMPYSTSLTVDDLLRAANMDREPVNYVYRWRRS